MRNIFIFLFAVVLGVNATVQAQEITTDEVQEFVNEYQNAFQSCDVNVINSLLDNNFTDNFTYTERLTQEEAVTSTKSELKQIMIELFAAGAVPEVQELICQSTVRLGQIKPIAEGVAFQTLEQSKTASRYCVSYGVKEAEQFRVAKTNCTSNKTNQ
jgi:carotenoid cleavage dioxygenase-like enzyme